MPSKDRPLEPFPPRSRLLSVSKEKDGRFWPLIFVHSFGHFVVRSRLVARTSCRVSTLRSQQPPSRHSRRSTDLDGLRSTRLHSRSTHIPAKKTQANVEKLIVRRSVAHPSLTRTIPRAGFHDAGQFSVADPQSIMELYCADEIAPIDRDQTCRGAPRARPAPSITQVVLGSHYPIIADARAGRRDGGARREGGPMTDPTTAITVVPDIKNDPADSRKAKVKAGAPSLTRARRARARGPKQQSRRAAVFFPLCNFYFLPSRR